MRQIITSLFFLIAGAPLLAQPRFVQEFRTPRNDRAVAVQQVENKEYLMLSQRFGLAGPDSFGINLTKMSDLGRLRWSRDFNFNFPVQGGDLVRWAEQNAYLVSATSSVDSLRSHVLVRFNVAGFPVWMKRIGHGNSIQPENGSRSRILTLADSAFVVAAGAATIVSDTAANDILLAKLDAEGDLIWSRRYCFSCQGNFDAALGDLLLTSDGGFLISGALKTDAPFGLRQEALLIKTDKDGQISWVRSYAVASSAINFTINAANLAEPKPGQYFWTGDYFDPALEQYDGVFVHVNASDTIPFSTRWNLAGVDTRIGTLDLLLRDTSGKGLVVMAGSAVQLDTVPEDAREYNFLAAVTADSLQLVWAKDYFPEKDADFTTPAHALTGTEDGGFAYYISIDSQMVNSNAVLVKTNDAGVTNCEEDLMLRLDSLPLTMTPRLLQTLDLTEIDTLVLKDQQTFSDIMPTMEGLELTGGGGQSCEPIDELLDATVQEAESYLWSTAEFTPTIRAKMAGMFTVEVSSESLCFYLPDTTTINVLPPPTGSAGLIPDTLCEQRQALLVANGTPVFTYTWSTGANTPAIIVDAVGTYTVTMTNPCGTLIAEVNVPFLGCICTPRFPNAFTPNGDGTNDRFLPVSACANITRFEFAVFNRWGEEMYRSASQTEGWNGEFNGKPASSDVYVWYVKYISVEGKEVTEKGDVTLLR